MNGVTSYLVSNFMHGDLLNSDCLLARRKPHVTPDIWFENDRRFVSIVCRYSGHLTGVVNRHAWNVYLSNPIKLIRDVGYPEYWAFNQLRLSLRVNGIVACLAENKVVRSIFNCS
jgi:hypothetical protein